MFTCTTSFELKKDYKGKLEIAYIRLWSYSDFVGQRQGQRKLVANISISTASHRERGRPSCSRGEEA